MEIDYEVGYISTRIMERASTISDVRLWHREVRRRGARVGFIPTMGYLHDGHFSLVKRLHGAVDSIVVSIFVNKLQFNDLGDYEKYPQDLERDASALSRLGVDLLFVPHSQEIYQSNFQTSVEGGALTASLEGSCRPGHFKGVTTVVAILFNIVQPDVVVFGEKDFQQLRIIEQMVCDLKLPIEVLRGPTIRETDGLAMSSRNVRLSPEARADAVALNRALLAMESKARSGVTDVAEILSAGRAILNNPRITTQYLSVVAEDTLEAISTLVPQQRYRALVAAEVGGVRLIDNLRI